MKTWIGDHLWGVIICIGLAAWIASGWMDRLPTLGKAITPEFRQWRDGLIAGTAWFPAPTEGGKHHGRNHGNR